MKSNKKYKDVDTGEVETYADIVSYWQNNEEIKKSFDSPQDLIEEGFYIEVKE